MRTVGACEARTHFGQLLASVAKGEVVQITRHGEPIAELRPLTKPERGSIAMRWLLASTVRLGGLNLRDLVREGRRSIKGTYVAPRPWHLQRYVEEQVFRFNPREDKVGPRFAIVTKRADGKLPTYKALINKT